MITFYSVHQGRTRSMYIVNRALFVRLYMHALQFVDAQAFGLRFSLAIAAVGLSYGVVKIGQGSSRSRFRPVFEFRSRY